MATWQRLFVGVTFAFLACVLSFAVAPAQDKKTPPPDKGKVSLEFEVYQAKDGYRFRIKEDEQILAITQKGYEKKEELMKVIDTIRKGAATAKLDDQTTKK
jgi:uncharacterized protein YegP (UPF0339 family)